MWIQTMVIRKEDWNPIHVKGKLRQVDGSSVAKYAILPVENECKSPF